MPRGIPNPKPAPDLEQGLRERIFLQALRNVLPSLKLYNDDRLRKRIGEEKLVDVTLEFFGYMESGAGKLGQIEQVALASRILQCLSKYISNVGTPTTLNTLLNSIQLIDAAVDIAFPGYAVNGLLRYAVRPVRVA